MTQKHRLLRLMVVIVTGAIGCASMKPRPGFDDIREDVADRAGGARVHWNCGSVEDMEAAAAVTGLLERNLTADAAVQIALLNNHDLQALYEELSLAQADVVQAGLLRNPIFSGEVRFVADGGGTGVVLGVAQDFVSLVWLPLRRGRAEAAFESAKLRITGAIVDMAAETRTAFFEYQAAEQTLEMRKTVAEATDASAELAKRLFEAGNFRELDLLNECDLHEQAKLDLALAEENVTQARERLNALMGVWGNRTQWRAEALLPSLPDQDFSADNVERTAIERSLDLAIARRDMEIAARSLAIAMPFGWLTDVDVGAASEREVDGAGWSVGPSISLPIPLFDQGKPAVRKAQARFREATERYYARAVEVRSRARAAYSVELSSRDRARYYHRVILPLRQRIVDQTQLQFNGMQVSAFQLLQAKRNQIDAGVHYIEALRDYWVARTALEWILSGRMTPFEGTSDHGTPSHGALAKSRTGHFNAVALDLQPITSSE